jgi:AraC-like DNA-binding protein
MVGKRLYERAAAATGALDPLWHIDDGRAVFAGPLTFNAAHRHAVPVYIAGLYAPFGLRLCGETWLTCRAAAIPAGISYELDVGGNALAVFYLEPNVAGVHALTPLVRNAREVQGALVGTAGEISVMRELYEDGASTRWAGSALDDLVRFSKKRAARTLDPRVARVVQSMHQSVDELTPALQVARSVGLSSSRFQHVFAQEVGVPYRRYRSWHRLRAAIREIVNGSSFTTAAHTAGFADQSHFAHTFRRTFGAPASPSLLRLRT